MQIEIPNSKATKTKELKYKIRRADVRYKCHTYLV